MHRLTFEIQHRGCWATAVSARFPETALVVRGSVPWHGRALDVTRVRCRDASEFRQISAFISRHEGVRSSTVLEQTGDAGVLLVETKPGRSLIDTITAHQGFLLAPTHVEQGVEAWTVGLAEESRAQALLVAVRALGEVRAPNLSRESFPDIRLSEAQRRVLRAAVTAGYYNFPRKISPTELSTRLGIAKSTLLEHLRKAEAKVMLAQEGQI